MRPILKELHVNEMKLWCFRPLLRTLFILNWAKQTQGIMRRKELHVTRDLPFLIFRDM